MFFTLYKATKSNDHNSGEKGLMLVNSWRLCHLLLGDIIMVIMICQALMKLLILKVQFYPKKI